MCCLTGWAAGQDSLSFNQQIEAHREAYRADFVKNEHSPLSGDDLQFLRFYAPDSTYRVTAAFTRTPYAVPFDMATYSGITKQYVQYGLLQFELQGDSIEMAVYQSLQLRQMPMYRDYLFIPFKDLTNGETTYGGGRYMDISLKNIVDEQITIDFNKAYNPYCAFSDGYNCPIPPTKNHLVRAIEAGEQDFAKATKNQRH